MLSDRLRNPKFAGPENLQTGMAAEWELVGNTMTGMSCRPGQIIAVEGIMIKKIVVVPDSFKGTMSSVEICSIMKNSIMNVLPSVDVVAIPVADGGEGTVDAFLYALGGSRIELKVVGPSGNEIVAGYGVLSDGKTAVIEMAAASGLLLVGDRKDPSITTTYGTGELIKHALDSGCTKIIVGIGGSATNDGGIGMAAALGIKFLDISGGSIPLTGRGLAGLHSIDLSERDPRLDNVEILVACDVDNPLYGPEGAAYVFAAQKGACDDMIEILDNNLIHYAGIVESQMGIEMQNVCGAGAAGGLGAGLFLFAGGKLKPGIEIVLDIVNFDGIIRDADIIITGEGKIDGQSVRGKVPVGVAGRAKLQNKPVIAIVGQVGEGAEKVYEKGITAIFTTCRVVAGMGEVKKRCSKDLENTVQDIFRLINNVNGNITILEELI
jgi:glycerate kinase